MGTKSIASDVRVSPFFRPVSAPDIIINDPRVNRGTPFDLTIVFAGDVSENFETIPAREGAQTDLVIVAIP